MSGAYALTRAADDDLADIARYTAERWGFRQAEAYLLALEAVFAQLVSLPDTGRPFAGRDGYFRIESGSHSVFSCKEPPGVLIVRVLHRHMEPRRHLMATGAP